MRGARDVSCRCHLPILCDYERDGARSEWEREPVFRKFADVDVAWHFPLVSALKGNSLEHTEASLFPFPFSQPHWASDFLRVWVSGVSVRRSIFRFEMCAFKLFRVYQQMQFQRPGRTNGSHGVCYHFIIEWMLMDGDVMQKQMANDYGVGRNEIAELLVFRNGKFLRSFNFDSMLSNQENFITYCHTRLNLIFAFAESFYTYSSSSSLASETSPPSPPLEM